jgi:predicted GIY-YIG superfamily endonuclease
MSTSTRGVGRHWVYRCFDGDGRLVYVGCTTNVPNRLEQHRTSSWWSPTVVKVTSKVYPDGETGRAAERDAIRSEVPRWNKSGKWAGRSKWTQEDWHDWISVLLRDGITPQLENSIRDYRSLFSEPIPAHLSEQYAEAEVSRKKRRQEAAERDALRDRERATRETTELRDLNDELTRTLARQEALARALGIDWDDPEMYDPGAEIDVELARRGESA